MGRAFSDGCGEWPDLSDHTDRAGNGKTVANESSRTSVIAAIENFGDSWRAIGGVGEGTKNHDFTGPLNILDSIGLKS